MKDKIFEALKNRKWKLLNQYFNEYPMNWMNTIKKCLEDENNLYEFRYNSNMELQRIRIITNYGECGSEWNFYIVFE